MRYTKEEIDFIKNNYDKMTAEEIADKLGRSVKGVRNKIERLGIKLSELERNQPYQWSESEINLLKKNYMLPDYKLAEIIPGKSESAIARKRLELGLKKHTYEPYVQGGYYQQFRDGQRVWIHRQEAEKKIGRKLEPQEKVHHVNGDKLDNSHDNLFVCKDKDHHGRVHAQLEQVAFELVKMGVIKFDHEKGEYFIDKSKLLTRTEG